MASGLPVAGSIFADARLKIERADEHIDELKVIVDEFFKTDFYEVRIEHDSDSDTYTLVLESTDPLPCRVPLLIGDAIHNLHTALDYSACAIVRDCGGSVDRWTKFPFRQSRDELVNAINGGEIKRAGQALVDCIVDTVQPYRGGNNPLYDLHDADIDDKHILLTPVIAAVALRGIHWKGDDGKGHLGVLTVSSGGRLQTPPTSAKLEIIDYGEPAFQIFFDKGNVLEGKPVVPSLHYLSQVVSGVVDALEQALA